MIMNLVAAITMAGALAISSPGADNALLDRRHHAENPIRLEGQIREIVVDGENFLIRLQRDRYPIAVHELTPVRWLDGRRAHAHELKVGDSIRISGDLDRDVILAERVTILQRVEQR